MVVDEIIDDEGEGVILRHIKSLYSSGRSPFLVKLKVSSRLLTSLSFAPLPTSSPYLYIDYNGRCGGDRSEG